MVFDRVLRLCEERNITISRLEKECGFGNATIRGWAKSDPRVSSVQTVANYFGITVDELLSDAE